MKITSTSDYWNRTSNKRKWNKKSEKSTSDERESFSKPNSAAESKILKTILKMDKGRTQTNGSEDKKAGYDAPGSISERWLPQTICVEKRSWKYWR